MLLRIHILRKVPEKDDIISIRQNLSRDFVVTYSDRECSVRYSFIASRDNLVSYFWSVFDFLRIDEEPFEKIQIVSPVHPSIMLCIKNLTHAKINIVMGTLRQLFNNWPHSLAAFSQMDECI
jgi:hypothetical protein